ncbi:LysR family transcriptional regulator [Shewanella schlegeliana]|uniref:LysR family transcriptional regulator n=1 Tax=Shewanella schlegeliana TaxID=190308 RepID=A0ABS1T207_9GAMM|nr:LysR family transcriptional regulator [Shewanella schlegeliana]MBL4914833.1 LysR family transcriptional regulator [Shewanella schlegeliana]MCL1110476.1 LysR family transcriptional regulator [Shewanella schlegeliana]GIU27499.1 LysR family transcriptional regulator [Shewanella schlegeliana]
MIDLNRIQMFAQVVEQGSFTRAANALGLTKATVSRKVAELEADAGVQLLHRTTRALKLTEAGADYFHRVNRILTDLKNAEDQLSARQQTIKGHLKIVCPIEMGQLYFGRIFARFLALYPDITIEAELTNRQVDVIAEGVDLLFQITAETDDRLKTYALINTPKILMASPEYLDKFGEPKTPEQLRQHQCIRISSPHIDGNWTLFNGKEWVTIEPESRLETNNITLMREAALEGLGIAAIPLVIANDALEKGELVTLLNDFPMKQSLVTMSMPQRVYLPRRYRVFIEFLYQALFNNWQDKVLEVPDFIERPEFNN